MLNYVYQAKDTKGQLVKAELEAQSEKAAASLLAKEGLTPISITLKGQRTGVLASLDDKVKTKDRILFTRQMSTLINAGLPLVQALRSVTEQTSSKGLQLILNKVINSVESGLSLSAALGKFPKVFNHVYISLVAAGEASGTLDETMERIATQQEKDAAAASKIRGAMLYPVIVLLVIGLVLVFLLTTVLPQIEVLYDDLNQPLPLITALMVAASRFFIRFWWLMFIIGGFGVYAMVWYVKNNEHGRNWIDRLKMKVPLFGVLFMKLYMARFSRTAATLLKSGVPLLEMMNITSRAVGNVHIERTIKDAAQKVKGGKAMSETLIGSPNFLPLVPQMIRIGEQSGALSDTLTKTADFYEEELDNQIKAISTIIEPALMVVLALVAGTVVGAILLPIYNLVGQNLAV